MKKFYIISKIKEDAISVIFVCEYFDIDYDINNSKIYVVIKVYKKFDYFQKTGERKKIMMDVSFKDESFCKILGKLKNDDIIIDKYSDNLYNHNGYGIIFEYIRGITIDELINSYVFNNEKYNNEELIINIIDQIWNAIKTFHSYGFIHKDIKPENIMITDDNKIKLIDYQFSDKEQKSNIFYGTYLYMAPEILKNEYYDAKSDVYSFGLVVFKLIEKKTIFDILYPNERSLSGINLLRLRFGYSTRLNEVCTHNLWKTNPNLFNFIENCLKTDPNERLYFLEKSIVKNTTVSHFVRDCLL